MEGKVRKANENNARSSEVSSCHRYIVYAYNIWMWTRQEPSAVMVFVRAFGGTGEGSEENNFEHTFN